MRQLYAQPEPKFGNTFAMITVHSPRQAMLMETILTEAMKVFAGKHQEVLLAKWHHEIVHMLDRAKRDGWPGWEDDYPVEPAEGKQG